MLKLWKHQSESIEAITSTRNLNPVVRIPTGGGKSLVVAKLAEYYRGLDLRVCAITHVQELISQLESSILEYSDLKPSVYCAGLGRKDLSSVTVGSVQSLANTSAAFDVYLVDEAHLVSRKDESQYQKIFNRSRHKRIGLSSTPYRLDDGPIYGVGAQFDELVYNVNYPELFALGSILEPRYLSTGRDQLDLTKLKRKGPDFDFSRFGNDSQPGFSTLKAIQSTMVLCDDRRSVMIFAASVAHAELIVDMLRYHDETADLVTSKTKRKDRAAIVGRFKNYETKYLVNVATLLVGFDHKGVDAISDLAPSMSPSRVEQKYGRCVRYLDGKRRPIILDYAGNCQRHGLLGSIKPKIEKKVDEDAIELSEVVICKSCGEMSPRGSKLCECGVELDEPELRDLNSGKLFRWIDGKSARYFLHDLKNGGQAIKIQFIEGSRTIETYLLFEHKFMKKKANELASQIFGYETLFANSFECYPFLIGQRFKRALVELSRFPKIQRIEKE